MNQYMYGITVCKEGGHAKVHVMALELEYTDEELVFTDFLELYIKLQDLSIDHILIVGSEDDKEWVDIVDRALHDLGFDCCDPQNFPE